MMKQDLSSNEQHLLSNMQSLNFGTIAISVKNGIIELNSMEIVREVRFSEKTVSKPRKVKNDYLLREKHITFIEHIRSLSDCKIVIEIKNGYPFRLLEQIN